MTGHHEEIVDHRLEMSDSLVGIAGHLVEVIDSVEEITDHWADVADRVGNIEWDGGMAAMP